jgi:hypothetical protein
MDGASVAALIDRYCEAWSDPDRERRRQILLSVWANDATYTDPRVHATTAEELLAHIERVLASRPGSKVRRTSNVDLHHNVARFGWRVVLAHGSSLPDGVDIAWLSADGRKLERIVGFFGPLAPL